MRQLLPILFLVACDHADHTPLEEKDDPRIADAKCAIQAKDWDAANARWGSPKRWEWVVPLGGVKAVEFNPAPGLTYRFEACGSSEASELDILLYDKDDKILMRDETEGPCALLTWSEKKGRQKYTVKAYLQSSTGGADAGVVLVRRSYNPPRD